MADIKISALPNAGTIAPKSNVIPLVSAGITAQANISSITTAALNATKVTVAQGGTNAATATEARTNLGLGTMAVQDSSNVSISGGSVAIPTLNFAAVFPNPDIDGDTKLIVNDGQNNSIMTLDQLKTWLRV